MSFENEELFEGIQIMTPSELNSKVTEGNPEEIKINKPEEEDFTIVPITTESGDSEVKEKKVVETTTETTPSSSNENKNEAIYKALITTLVEEGVITEADQEKLAAMPGNIESIKSLVSKTIEDNANMKQETWKKGLSSEKKRFLEIEDAFDQTDHAIIMAQRLEFFDTLTEDKITENETLQKQILYEQLTSLKNFTHEEALEALEETTASGKLLEKSIKAAPELKTQANDIVKEAKVAREARTAEEVETQTKAFQSLLDNVDARESFIDGLTLNKVSKDKLKNNIIAPVYKDPKSGKEYTSLMYKQMKNQAEFEMLINYYDTLGMFNIDKDGKFKPDISKLKTVAKTAAITELDKVISSENERGVGRNTSVEMSDKSKGILDVLEKAFKKK